MTDARQRRMRRLWCAAVVALVCVAGCASQSDHDALAVRVATIEAEMAAQERQEERLSALEDRLLSPDDATNAPDVDDSSECDDAKRRWRDLQPRMMSWFQDNEPEIFAAWIAEPPGTPDDDRLWQALDSAVPDDLAMESIRIETDGQMHCGYDEFNDYVDHGYNTGEFPG